MTPISLLIVLNPDFILFLYLIKWFRDKYRVKKTRKYNLAKSQEWRHLYEHGGDTNFYLDVRGKDNLIESYDYAMNHPAKENLDSPK
jgi:hypothetical protein